MILFVNGYAPLEVGFKAIACPLCGAVIGLHLNRCFDRVRLGEAFPQELDDSTLIPKPHDAVNMRLPVLRAVLLLPIVVEAKIDT